MEQNLETYKAKSKAILQGAQKALDKLISERAANNETLVMSINGEVTHVPAKDLLKVDAHLSECHI